MKTTTFILHGKYDDTHIQMCNELSKYGQIILSSNSVNPCDLNLNLYDKVIIDNKNLEVYNHQNIYNHVNSVLNGIKLCDADYVVKIPMKHCFSNIQYIIDCLNDNQNDIYLCSNITINPGFPFHFCDNIIAGTRNLMLGIFNTAYESIINNNLCYDGIDMHVCSEIFLFASYLKYKQIKIENVKYFFQYTDFSRNSDVYEIPIPINYSSMILNNLKLIDIEKLTPYKINFTSNNVEVRSYFKSVERIIEKSKYK